MRVIETSKVKTSPIPLHIDDDVSADVDNERD